MDRDTQSTFITDERAVAPVIGFVFLFGIGIIVLSSYQASVVPSQNAEVEFNHNEDVQNDIQDLRNSLLDVRSVERVGDEEYAIVSEHRPTRVRLGTRFPERLIALNPPAPSGTLSTVETSTPVEIQNADVDGTKEDRFPDDVSALFEPHETAFLTYQPRYSEYQSAPNTVLEHSLLYNDHPETDLIVRDQNVVNTSRGTINIVLFDGDFSSSSSRAVTLDPQTLDGPTAPVPIVRDGGNIRLRLPVESREVWDQSMDQTSEAQIIEAESSEEEIVIELEGDEYDLRMSKVGFDGGEKDDQFTPIQTKEPLADDPDATERLPGPHVVDAAADPSEDLEVGDTFDLTASITNVGDDDNNRGGTPIQRVEWYIGGDQSTVTEFPDSPTDLTQYSLSVSQPEIEVDDRFETGENDIQIRAQDSRGIWGDEREVTVDVIPDEEDLQISTRIDDLSAVDTNNVRFLTSFDIAGEDEDSFERVRVEVRQDGNSIGEDSISNTRGSVELESAFGVGDEFDISIEVIYTDENGDEFVEESRIETVTADGENTIEDDLSMGDSPSFDSIDIIDESAGNAQFRVNYLVDQPDGFEVDGALIGLESGTGFDRDQNSDQDGEIELSTYGSGGEFKVVGLLREENTGVVVDAGSEIRTAENEPAPPFFDVTIDTTNSSITEGETLTVDATIENTGEQEGTQEIELLDFDGTVVDTRENLTLGTGASETVELIWQTEEGDAGTDDITVQSEDDSDTAEVTIEETEPADPTFETLEAEAGGGNIQDVDVTFEISEEADVEIEITPGDTESFANVTPNQERTENVIVTGNTSPVDVAVSLFDSDTGEQIIRCEGTLEGNNDFLTIDPGPEDSEFNCEY